MKVEFSETCDFNIHVQVKLCSGACPTEEVGKSSEEIDLSDLFYLLHHPVLNY